MAGKPKVEGLYGRKPRIIVEDLQGKSAAIVTVKNVTVNNFAPEGEEPDKKIVITTEEFGSKELVLNSTMYKQMCKKLGEDFTKWEGERIPLVEREVNDPRTSELVEKVWIAPTDKAWDEVMKKDKKGK